MQRNRIAFGLLALGAAVLAACSSGGGGAVVPPAFQSLPSSALQSFAGDTRHWRHPVRATVYLRIPAPRRHHRHRRMHPQYVSPGTASISFAVKPIAASGPQQTPMPLQTMNVATPHPCAIYPSSGGALQCTFTVSVMPGRDSFVVKTYTGSNASGKVLSEYTSGSTIIPTPNPKGTLMPLGFTLEGAIDRIVLQYPNSVVPADTQGQVGAIPVGVATTAPLNVTPYDAANYQILSQVPATGTPVPYAAPVTLSVTPTGKGMTLSNASGSGNSVTISGPNDLNVDVVYSGAFTASGGSVSSTTSFSIAAAGTTLALRSRKVDLHAPRTATPAPNAAGIALSGNVIPGGTVPTALTTTAPLSLVNVGGTGQMAFFVTGYTPGQVVNALIGTANGGVVTSSGTNSDNIANANFADSLGNLWVYDHVTGQIQCFAAGSYATPAGSIPSTSLIPGGGTFYGFAGFAEDSSNNLWFAVYGTFGSTSVTTIGYVPINGTSCSAPAPAINQALPTDSVYLYDLTAIPGTGVAVGSYDFTTSTGSVMVGTTAVPTPNVSTTSLGFAVTPGSMFTGPTSGYALINSSGAESLGTVSATGAYANVANYDIVAGGFLNGATAAGASASGLLGATTYASGYAAIDNGIYVTLLNPADTNPSSNFEAVSVAKQCQGIAFDAQDTAWTLCLNAQKALQFYHIVPTSTWSVMPSTVVPVALKGSIAPYTGSVYLGILEAFGATNGPFTLANYDSSIVTGITPEGDRGIGLTLSVPTLGQTETTVDVVDKNGRSVPVTFEVNAIYYAGTPPRHGARARARRGYPPVSRN